MIHGQWVICVQNRREEDVANEAEVRRCVETCHRLGMEIVLYVSPDWAYLTNPVTQWNWVGQPKWGGDGDGTFYKSFEILCHASRGMLYQLARAKRIVDRYGLDGIYQDGAYGNFYPCYRDHPEVKGPHHRIKRGYQMAFGIRRLVDDHSCSFGNEGYGSMGGPFRCLYQTTHLYGESVDYVSAEELRDYRNGKLNGLQFKLWGRHSQARMMKNIALCGVNLADIEMVIGNYGGLEDASAEEWERISRYWQLLSMVDFDHLTKMKAWWEQKLVRGDVLAAYYLWPDAALVFVANREGEKGGERSLVFDIACLAGKESRVTVRRLYPEPEEFGSWSGIAEIRQNVPPIEEGYLAYLIE